MRLTFSIVLPTYKESNLGILVKKLLAQDIPKGFNLQRIIIVGLGFDKSDLNKIKKIHVIEEKFRNGKAIAITKALKNIKSDVIILQSSDTQPADNTLKNILLHFRDEKVGMVTGRPIPSDNPKYFSGFLNHLVWFLHHLISLQKPKATEITAFRVTFKKLPKKLVADEAYMESLIYRKGLNSVYSPKAIVYNKGPKSIKDFIAQRRRIFIGHLQIKDKFNYSVSTLSITRTIIALLEFSRKKLNRNYKEILWLILAILLESYARLLGAIDYFIFNKIPYKWSIIKSAKL